MKQFIAIFLLFLCLFNASNADLRRNDLAETPIGTVISFAGITCPTGYLATDGTSYLQSLYPKLFIVIGTIHGSIDSTHFNVPDYRGLVLRMIDGTKNNDPDKLTRTAMNTGGATGNSVGSIQADSFQGHYHREYYTNAGGGGNNVFLLGGGGTVSYVDDRVQVATTDGVNGTPRYGLETRPKNAYINYCIKY